MDSVYTSDDNCDLGGFQSWNSSMDQTDNSVAETMSYSRLSGDSLAYFRSNSGASALSDDNIYSDVDSPISWRGLKTPVRRALSNLRIWRHEHGFDQEIVDLDMKLMKERFSKLLLGEDMSGSGLGVCSAVTISNAITNLYASIFGQHQRLEPLHPDKKLMWKREMNCLLSVCDYILEFAPTLQSLEDGTAVEVMTTRPRPDIYVNLPALKKLDAMLLEILDGFKETEFCYAEQGSISANSSLSGSFRRIVQPLTPRKEDKWWLPVPYTPENGLSEKFKKLLKQKRNCANQIYKAAMAINNEILSEMHIPESFVASLPKSGRDCIGDGIYRYMCNAEKFSPNYLLDSLNITSEHEALQLADKVEASMYIWRRKICTAYLKSSWEMMKDFISEMGKSNKNYLLAERAEILLFYLKQRYPELSQTTLDTSKIQYNKDVGQAVLESYSRVLEGMAFNIVAWIEDVLIADRTLECNIGS